MVDEKTPQWKEEERQTNKGRTTIDNPAREGAYSRRAQTGKIEITKTKTPCKHCGHRKIIKTDQKRKCSKCKKTIR